MNEKTRSVLEVEAEIHGMKVENCGEDVIIIPKQKKKRKNSETSLIARLTFTHLDDPFPI